MRIYLRILITKLKSYGTLNLFIMKHMKKTVGKKSMMKAKNGREVTSKAPDNSIVDTTYGRKGNVKKITTTSAEDNTKQIDRYNRRGELKSSVTGTVNERGRLTDKNRLSKSTIDQMNMKKRFTANPEDRTLGEDMDMMKKGGPKKTTYKTGGMTNSNAKVSALLSAGSKGVKSGVNSKISASKSAKGPGKRSSAPKAAVPKAKYGMMMKKKK